jgi:hypothetical protein
MNPSMVSPQKSAELIELSLADKDAVLLQTERLLASPHFKNSRRYTDLLRYVVQQTIDGHSDTLKERTLGIEVFGREPGFDTAGDSIVRVAAAEVRKRIAQYYQEDGHEDELRIDLPSGSYAARFRRPLGKIPEVVAGTDASAISPTDHSMEQAQTSTRHSRWMRLAIVTGSLMVVAFAIALGSQYMDWPPTQRDLLRPLWKSPNDVILCIGSPLLAQNQPGVNDQAEATALGQPTANNTVIPLSDAVALSRFQVLLNSHRKANRVQLARNTTFDDLRAGPAILIGALDNPWTLRLTEKLRFHFRGTDAEEGEIVDSKAKPDGRWSVNFHVPYSDRTQDYAIAAITHDDTLNQPLVVAAGIGPNGTMAASEFLMDRSNLDALKRMAPANWSGKNVEVVLATPVIQGNSGPPQIVAVEYW